MRKKNDSVELEIVTGIGDAADGVQQVIPIVADEDGFSESVTIPNILPILSLRSSVLFPGSITPITVGREKSIKLVRDIEKNGGVLGAVLQREADVEQPAGDDMYKVGTAASIIKILEMPNGNLTVILHGLEKIEIVEYLSSEPYFTASVNVLKDVSPDKNNVDPHHNITIYEIWGKDDFAD